jgi:hypothetical protein
MFIAKSTSSNSEKIDGEPFMADKEKSIGTLGENH